MLTALAGASVVVKQEKQGWQAILGVKKVNGWLVRQTFVAASTEFLLKTPAARRRKFVLGACSTYNSTSSVRAGKVSTRRPLTRIALSE